eukprot:TRINITY_DN7168_c0_g1_i1.p1 TRINITY_DN7168_c0_g1~~TRINITY_DN7168_c0_g1_i1.p1  ORF type:complete len:394 (-),score=38.94 TRINITY_DN7168_c0_g1_i1:438-1619(-)
MEPTLLVAQDSESALLTSTSNKSYLHLFLLFLIGTTSWLQINGLFVQLPIYVNTLPESYGIAAYFILCTQIGNFFGLAYYLIRRSIKFPIEKYAIMSVLVVAIAISAFYVFTWDIVYDNISFYLLLYCVVAGGVGSVSVVSMIPFAASYGTVHTSVLSSGMGASGIIASVFALIQQPQAAQLFSTEVFSGLCGCVSFVSIISLIVLLKISPVDKVFHSISINDVQLSPKENIYMLCIKPGLSQLLISIMNYFALGLLTFSVSGFESENVLVFWISLLGVFFGAAFRMATVFIKFKQIVILSLVQSLFWVYVVVFAFLDNSKLPSSVGWSVVVAATIFQSLYGYTDTTNYNYVVDCVAPKNIGSASRFIGICNQAGALIGSITVFVLVITGILS